MDSIDANSVNSALIDANDQAAGEAVLVTLLGPESENARTLQGTVQLLRLVNSFIRTSDCYSGDENAKDLPNGEELGCMRSLADRMIRAITKEKLDLLRIESYLPLVANNPDAWRDFVCLSFDQEDEVDAHLRLDLIANYFAGREHELYFGGCKLRYPIWEALWNDGPISQQQVTDARFGLEVSLAVLQRFEKRVLIAVRGDVAPKESPEDPENSTDQAAPEPDSIAYRRFKSDREYFSMHPDLYGKRTATKPLINFHRARNPDDDKVAMKDIRNARRIAREERWSKHLPAHLQTMGYNAPSAGATKSGK